MRNYSDESYNRAMEQARSLRENPVERPPSPPVRRHPEPKRRSSWLLPWDLVLAMLSVVFDPRYQVGRGPKPCYDIDDTRNGDLGYRNPYRG